MTDLAALHAAVLAHPDEDTPRLIYADALDERGGEGDAARAEFIRWHIANPHGAPRDSGLRPWHFHLSPGGPRWQMCGSVSAVAEAMPRNPHFPAAGFDRGFLSCVWLTAADWLAHADALVWRPGQTVECEECRGDGRLNWYARHGSCTTCDGTGRVPRPCPPTAQPITRVVLTTWPDRNEVECAAPPPRPSTTTRQHHADALVWRPGQTVECGGRPVWGQGKWQCVKCEGFGPYQLDEGEIHRCTGRVPRPCPPTAQPITRVVLTTWPDRNEVECAAPPPTTTTHRYRVRGRREWFDSASCEAVGDGSILAGLFTITWPGITFVGPTDPAVELLLFSGESAVRT